MVSPNAEPSKGGQPQQDEGSGAPIDPTKNVLDLVKAESKYQDGMRDALDRRIIEKIEAEGRYQNASASSEVKRLDSLAAQKRDYEDRIAMMLRVSVEERATASRKDQDMINERLNKLEQSRYEINGKTSVADPALSAALSALTSGQITAQTAMTDALGRMSASISSLRSTADTSAGGAQGRQQFWGWIVGGAIFVGTVISIIGALVALRGGG